MKKYFVVVLSLVISSSLIAAPRGKKTQVSYTSSVCESYAQVGHGNDGQLFLNPYLQNELANVSGKIVLDAGCGAGSWSVVAAKNGASVCGIDIQSKMISLAQSAIAQEGVEKEVSLYQGDVTLLPFEANYFDQALSVNVGCNLLGTSQTMADVQIAVLGLDAHCSELSRVLKSGGHGMITAPASFGVVFTNNLQDDKAVEKHIQRVLAKIGKSEKSEVIVKHLGELTEVNRATFVRRNGKLKLVIEEKELLSGEPIWRKIPGAVVPNYYHSEEEYLIALNNAGLTCVEIKRPCFFSKVKWEMHQATLSDGETGLSEAYIENNPFTIYYVKKV